MRVLVYPHDLGMGGSQLNAIEIAATVRDRGHEIVIFAEPGPLLTRVEELGLEYVRAPTARVRPSPSTVLCLRRAIASRGIDLVHAYEWPPAMNACIAVAGSPARAVATIMSMSVAPFLPRTMPLVVGTREIGAIERQLGRRDVTVLEPPVHLAHNDRRLLPDAPALRRALGLAPGSTVVTAVSRLAHELKMEGLLTAIEVVPRLGANIQLLVVGDGPARAEVDRAASLANDALGREAVVIAGELADPRPAYAVADIALGMGGSVLRAMSFAKPVVVQGELGFWKVLDEDTIDDFLWHGWYGLGAGRGAGADALTAELQPLLADPLRRRRLGQYGRALVENRFSLEHAADLQTHQYESVMAADTLPLGVALADGVRSVVQYVGHAGERKWGRLRGQAARDDFNRTGPQSSDGAAARRVTPRSTPVFKES